jgi:hypothetical protein
MALVLLSFRTLIPLLVLRNDSAAVSYGFEGCLKCTFEIDGDVGCLECMLGEPSSINLNTRTQIWYV